MARVLAIAVFALLACSVLAGDEVVVGTKANFKDLIAKDDLTLVKFYAPWCGHCKAMAKDFVDAAAELKGKAVLADVDATVEKELAEQYGVRGFPTLKLFSKGEVVAEYKGGRKKDDIVKYIERAMVPSITELESADAVAKFIKENSGKAVLIGAKLDTLAKLFKEFSMSVRDLLPDGVAFGAVADPAHLKDASSEAIAADNVLLIRDDGTTSVFSGEAKDLDTFVKMGVLPLFVELNKDNANLYTELQKPIFILFQDPKKKDEKVNEDMKEVSKAFREKNAVAFVWINSEELKSFKDHMGVKNTPGIAIYHFEDDSKYTFDGEYSLDSVKAWVSDFIEGKIKPTMKSAPIPEKNDEPVKVVVGDTWEKIVQDETKDVLIEQYAPWCGHCKRLEPTLVELAKDLAGVKTLVIAKMDATENDAPTAYKARGFPTIHFFPAGKTTGVAYEGGRAKEDFIKYLKEQATHKEGFPEEKHPEADAKDPSKDKDEL